MRTFATVAVILALLAGGSFWNNHIINSSAGTLVQQINQVEAEIQNQDWGQAKTQLQEMKKQWDGTKNAWSVLLNHQEIDNIDLGLARLEEYVRFKSPVLAAGELSALRLLMDHVADTETFTLRNIL